MLAVVAGFAIADSAPWLEFPGGPGPGAGKHVVLLAGDEEYRSEEGLPQLAAILSRRHGFRCTVLFSIAPDGAIDPTVQTNQPGLAALRSADVCVMLLRFRRWPDDQMREFVEYWRSGRPIFALRTSTHAFQFPPDSPSVYRVFDWRSPQWPGGFGEQVLGENWVSHWGDHGRQATRGVPAARAANHPVLRGVRNVFGPSDVYEAHPPPDAEILMEGEVVDGMSPGDPAARGRKARADGTSQPVNDPRMPIAWTRLARNDAGKTNRILVCTMGAATDLESEGLRRLAVNAVYWLAGLESRIPAASDVRLVGDYRPSPFGFGAYRTGVRPADLRARFGLMGGSPP